MGMIRWRAKPAYDGTAPKSLRPGFCSVMIVPPDDSERGSARYRTLMDLERFLLNSGVRVVSSGATSRVLARDAPPDADGAAVQLSDVERALLLAREFKAEAILQVAELGPEAVQEVATVQSVEGRAYYAQATVNGSVFRFRGRLIDVDSAEIALSFDVAQDTLRVEGFAQKVDTRRPLAPISRDTEHLKTAAINQVFDVIGSYLVRAPRCETPAAAL